MAGWSVGGRRRGSRRRQFDLFGTRTMHWMNGRGGTSGYIVRREGVCSKASGETASTSNPAKKCETQNNEPICSSSPGGRSDVKSVDRMAESNLRLVVIACITFYQMKKGTNERKRGMPDFSCVDAPEINLSI